MDHPWHEHFPGRFVEGRSTLHRLDPRSKLLALPALILACFWLEGLVPLCVLGGVQLGLLRLAGIPWRQMLRLVRSLRYLLLFTLLVYVLFTPGYTLLGLSWLSRDGLVTGLTVCLQLVLALGFSLLLSVTTSPAALATGFEALLSPLKRFRVPVTQVGDSLRLVLFFVDQLLERLATLRPRRTDPPGLRATFRWGTELLGELLAGLLNQAESLAQRIADGDPLPWSDEVKALPGLRVRDVALLVSVVLLLVLLGGGV